MKKGFQVATDEAFNFNNEGQNIHWKWLSNFWKRQKLERISSIFSWFSKKFSLKRNFLKNCRLGMFWAMFLFFSLIKEDLNKRNAGILWPLVTKKKQLFFLFPPLFRVFGTDWQFDTDRLRPIQKPAERIRPERELLLVFPKSLFPFRIRWRQRLIVRVIDSSCTYRS